MQGRRLLQAGLLPGLCNRDYQRWLGTQEPRPAVLTCRHCGTASPIPCARDLIASSARLSARAITGERNARASGQRLAPGRAPGAVHLS